MMQSMIHDPWLCSSIRMRFSFLLFSCLSYLLFRFFLHLFARSFPFNLITSLPSLTNSSHRFISLLPLTDYALLLSIWLELFIHISYFNFNSFLFITHIILFSLNIFHVSYLLSSSVGHSSSLISILSFIVFILISFSSPCFSLYFLIFSFPSLSFPLPSSLFLFFCYCALFFFFFPLLFKLIFNFLFLYLFLFFFLFLISFERYMNSVFALSTDAVLRMMSIGKDDTKRLPVKARTHSCTVQYCSILVDSHHVMSCHVISCHFMLYYVISCHVMSCNVMLYITNLTLFV